MGRIFLSHIGGTRLFSCASCDTILTNRSELISTRFTGATGRAFLFNKAINLVYSDVQDRVMLTGRHIVRDVTCKNCDAKVGWMYEFATEENQRYKEGRVILERALITESEGFEEVPAPGTTTRRTNPGSVPVPASSVPVPATAAIFSSFLGAGTGPIGSGGGAGMLIPREIFNFYGISPYALEAVAAGAVVAAAAGSADAPAPQHTHPQAPRRNNFVGVPRSTYMSPRTVLDGHGEGNNNPRPIFRSARMARTQQQPSVVLGESNNANNNNATPITNSAASRQSSNVPATTTINATPQADTTNSSILSATSSSLLPSTRDNDEAQTPNHYHQSTSRRQRTSSSRSTHHHHHPPHHHGHHHPVHDPVSPHPHHHHHHHHPVAYHSHHHYVLPQVANDESREQGGPAPRETQRSSLVDVNSCDEILPASAMSSSSPLTSPVSSDFPPDTPIRTTFLHYFDDDRYNVSSEIAVGVIERAQEAMVVEESQNQENEDNSSHTQ